jgi:hypothetical protein
VFRFGQVGAAGARSVARVETQANASRATYRRS